MSLSNHISDFDSNIYISLFEIKVQQCSAFHFLWLMLHHFPLVIIKPREVFLHVQIQLHDFNLFECENWNWKTDPNLSLYIYWNTFFGDDKYINKVHSQSSSIYWVLIVMLLYSCITTDSDFFMLPGDTRGAISFSTNYLVFYIWYFAVYGYTLTSVIVTDGWIFAQYRIFLYQVQTWCYVLLVTSATQDSTTCISPGLPWFFSP